jgi:hypothetical protein
MLNPAATTLTVCKPSTLAVLLLLNPAGQQGGDGLVDEQEGGLPAQVLLKVLHTVRHDQFIYLPLLKRQSRPCLSRQACLPVPTYAAQ